MHKSLFSSFLELAGRTNTPVTPLPLIDNDTQVLPVTIQKDRMGLKPGMEVDSTQVKIINWHDSKHRLQIYQRNPDPGELKDIFITEAERYCATSLDGK